MKSPYYHLISMVVMFITIGITNPSYSQQQEVAISGMLEYKTNDSLIIYHFSPQRIADYHLLTDDDMKETKLSLSSQGFHWKINTSSPIAIFFSRKDLPGTILEPGDNIRIIQRNGQYHFEGKGSVKFRLLEQINAVHYKPRVTTALNALDKFIFVSQHCDTIAARKAALIFKYKDSLSHFAYTYIEADLISVGEHHRTNAFGTLLLKRKELGLTAKNICDIYDSTFQRSKLLNIPLNDTSILGAGISFFYMRGFKYYAYYRDNGFTEDFLQEESVRRKTSYYYYTKNKYQGTTQKRFLTAILSVEMMRKGLPQEYMECISDFMSTFPNTFHSYYIQNKLSATLTLQAGELAPDFKLQDTIGNIVGLKDFQGRIVFMDFWFTGCKGCVQLAQSLQEVEKRFSNNPNVVFLSINTDPQKKVWKKSIAKGKYTAPHSFHLFTEGKGSDHPMLKSYNVSSFPRMFFIDPQGRIISYPAPDPRNDNGKALAAAIEQQLAELPDGPYLRYSNKDITVKKINNYFQPASIERFPVKEKNKIELTISGERPGKYFSVGLKDSLSNEPSVFDSPSKILALSDIEGELTSFVQLLTANKIIDTNYNWSFGKGHLVLNGDIFDRGSQVTQCLWLIYKMEQQAKAAGGYVHYILGNHEIMNLQGDTRYRNAKYEHYLPKLKEQENTLFDENTELGRWLRTKNIMEKVGYFLFVHGGISKECNTLDLDLNQINDIVRQKLRNPKNHQLEDSSMSILFNNDFGPYWYRGYFQGERADMNQVQQTLKKFKVRHIVTGHTIIADTVSTHYEGRILNTDTRHAHGHSEALLIQDKKIYRCNHSGKISEIEIPTPVYTKLQIE